jgi:hypothetical protein
MERGARRKKFMTYRLFFGIYEISGELLLSTGTHLPAEWGRYLAYFSFTAM